MMMCLPVADLPVWAPVAMRQRVAYLGRRLVAQGANGRRALGLLHA